MQAKIGARLLKSIKPTKKAFDVRDETLKGFILRVQPSGSMSYVVQIKRVEGRITLGKTSVLTPAQARARAKILLADKKAAEKELPSVRREAKEKAEEEAKRAEEEAKQQEHEEQTLAEFLQKEYEPWIVKQKGGNVKDPVARAKGRRKAELELDRLKKQFPELLGKPLKGIEAEVVEEWKARRLEDGIKPATINRDLTTLKTALTRATKLGYFDSHPLTEVKHEKVDNARCEFLSAEEEARLMDALDERESAIKCKGTNKFWRRRVGLGDFNGAAKYADHIKPMVLVSLHTGLRRGELLSLRWQDVNMQQRFLTVQGVNAKTGATRHVSLNQDVYDTIKQWKEQLPQEETAGDRLVFVASKPNLHRVWKSVLKRAGISDFRWHDMRHDFASKLAMSGVELYTVSKLLGHKNLTMTMRYAHLSPEHMSNAVAHLVRRK